MIIIVDKGNSTEHYFIIIVKNIRKKTEKGEKENISNSVLPIKRL